MIERHWEQLTPNVWEYLAPHEYRKRPAVPPPAIERRSPHVGPRGGKRQYFAVQEGVECQDGWYPHGPFDTLQEAQDAIV